MRVSEEFGRLVEEIRNGDSFGKLALKTGISKAYLIDMAGGKVPMPETLRKFVDACKVSDEQIQRLYEAAGYELPASLSSHASIDASFRTAHGLSDEGWKAVKEIIEAEEEKHRK